MSNTDLNETLTIIGRVPGQFRRDTPMLLETLRNVEKINRELQKSIYETCVELTTDKETEND